MNAIGWAGETGMQRTAFSAAHVQVREWFLERARAAGLETRVDSAGNHSAIHPARRSAGADADARLAPGLGPERRAL